jgi:hypothetical protein
MCKICWCSERAAALFVEAPRYKPESRGLGGVIGIFIGIFFRPHYGPGFDPASNRNEYQEYFLEDKGGRCLGLTTLPPSCASSLEIWECQPSGTLRACPGLYRDCFALLLFVSVLLCMGCYVTLRWHRNDITFTAYVRRMNLFLQEA